MSILNFFFITLILFGVAYSVKWEFCDPNADYKIRIESARIYPDPIKIGKNVLGVLNGTLLEEIDGGTLKIQLKYGGQPIYKIEDPICSAPQVFLCPHKPGFVSLSKTVPIPSFTPSGTYTGEVTIFDQNIEVVVCIKFTMDIMK
ncbi:niemann pick type c2 protein npc2-related [Anaeramoeba flamelloides]|uniref:Niemann pick type c2 protein npc2-related n=1 Tax=Anaeramoeba flamelloides TaxID=1746091 RepID=A0ABQ8YV16_9EUKA|nr:niemann pick type c2 protein npc2-related [Anaeramoeba flamelloides]